MRNTQCVPTLASSPSPPPPPLFLGCCCLCDSSENGLEIHIPTTLPTAVVGMEIMEGFSDHGSFDGGDDADATSPIHSPAALA